MKIFFTSILLLLLSIGSMAQVNLKLEIAGVEKNGGKVYVSVFNSEKSYNNRDVFKSFSLDPNAISINALLKLTEGEYLFSIYQDNNDNGVLDTNLVGIPKEKFGFTNYDGKRAPGGFKRHKILIIKSSSKILVNLYKI
jgi:uncharacterized protein (DUF2141 family)